MRRFRPDIRLFLAIYALLLAAGITVLPLRISEILHIIGSLRHSAGGFFAWIPQAPGSAPLHYFVQLPSVLVLGASRWGARLPSLLFGLASCYLFWRIAKRIPLRWPYLALVVFAVLPSHYIAATDGLPTEQALFLLLGATEFFLNLIETPTLRWAICYGAALTLAIYTERYSILPAVGYLLALFAFVNSAPQRRAIWFALGPTVAATLLFLPCYFWARAHVNPHWLTPPLAPDAPSSPYLQALQQLASGGALGYLVSALLIIGVIMGVWGRFRVPPAAMPKSVRIFSMFGGAVITILVVLGLDVGNRYAFTSQQVLWALPGIILTSFAGLERFGQRPNRRMWAYGAAVMLLALCTLRDIDYLANPTEDLAQQAALIRPELTGDSCVVFVSQGLSQHLFLVFDPGLDQSVCRDFFHARAVLASHAYVRPSQQENAESFFRGLNFKPVKRVHVGGGQIVIMQTTGK
jgi:4-amino-4-deoxy-L-arabinose transferase-like glycosyltransferase